VKVIVGRSYLFYPNLLDRYDGRANLVPGDIVKVINLPGAPKANVMGHCYVASRVDGAFLGMVHTNSLHKLSDRQLVIDAIKKDIARQEAR
jgi:hypothetical protein